MRKRILVFSFSTLLLGLVLVASPPGRGVYSQSQPMFVAKGTFWVSGQFNEVQTMQTGVGQRLSAKSKGNLRVDKVNVEASLSGKRLNLESPELKAVIQAIADSVSGTLDDNSTKVQRKMKKGGSPDVVTTGEAKVKNELISFVLPVKSNMALPAEQKRRGGGDTSGEGTIENISTRVKELQPLNGLTIKVTGDAHVDEVDALGVARVRIDFEMRSTK